MAQAPQLAADAQVFSGAYDDARRRVAQEELQKQAQAAALQQMLTGQENQARLGEAAKVREGEQALGALNEFLRGAPSLADRLGRRAEGPMPEGIAGPGAPVFNPYQATGAGAGVLADFVKGEMTNASAEARASAQQQAEMLRSILKMDSDRQNLEYTEGGKDRRQGNELGWKREELDVKEGGLWGRMRLGETGKNARNAATNVAITGETTLRAQLSQMDEYIKALNIAAQEARLQKFMSAKDPARAAAATLRFDELQAEIQRAQEQYRAMLGPRTPTVTQPTIPQAAPSASPTEQWQRGPDGKLIRVR